MNYKNIFLSMAIVAFSTISLMSACKSEETGEPQADSDIPGKPCTFLKEALIRETFNVSADIDFETTDKDNICMYGWMMEGVYYSISLNFAHGGQRDDAAAQAAWQSQNDGVYKDKELQEVADVGDQASWSTLGGGQLRVLQNGWIFYVSFSTMFAEDPMPTSEMIAKTSIIAEEVIKDL